MAQSHNPDVIVVGAGVVGTSIAFHLARGGVRVTIVDKGDICSGMTARSGALLRMHYSFAPEAALAWKSLSYFANWREMVGVGDPGFVRTGFAIVVGPRNVAKLRANVAMLRELGIDTNLCEPRELNELDAGINTDEIALAAYEPRSGYADPVATTRALADAVSQLGATIMLRTCVERIIYRGHRATGLRLYGGEELRAGAVCLATGPWTDSLLARHAPCIGLKTERAQIALFRRDPATRHIGCIDTVAGAYFRPHGESLTLAGLGAWRPGDEPDPDDFRQNNDPDFVKEVARRLGQRVTAMRGAPYVRGHAGIYDVSPDARAVLGKVPGIDNLYVAAGFSGTGFKTAPAVGAAMAELILSGRDHTVDITPFRFERLIEGALIESPNEYEMGADFGHKL
ncbi:MAG TPA: FAD-binding oxidoreductase [Candidatus Binataceae bacterium]|nr:FAD-binding oxidoreductase [Candidatus Binataceae bacterium]